MQGPTVGRSTPDHDTSLWSPRCYKPTAIEQQRRQVLAFTGGIGWVWVGDGPLISFQVGSCSICAVGPAGHHMRLARVWHR